MKKAENDCGGIKTFTIKRPSTTKAKPAAKKAATKKK